MCFRVPNFALPIKLMVLCKFLGCFYNQKTTWTTCLSPRKRLHVAMQSQMVICSSTRLFSIGAQSTSRIIFLVHPNRTWLGYCIFATSSFTSYGVLVRFSRTNNSIVTKYTHCLLIEVSLNRIQPLPGLYLVCTWFVRFSIGHLSQ